MCKISIKCKFLENYLNKNYYNNNIIHYYNNNKQIKIKKRKILKNKKIKN